MEPLRTNNNIGNEYQYCKGCERNLPLSVFITSKKSYKYCITCREQGKKAYQQHKQQTNAETGNQISIELNELYEFLPKILDAFEKEESENQENIGNQELAFSCTINIVTLEGNSKDRANHIIKMISDIDDYVWMQSMHRYTCNGCIKITIFEDLASSNIEIKHHLHPKKADTSISPEIKQFILDNIDLLPREIYKRLVEQGLNINIRQKQVHFSLEQMKFRYLHFLSFFRQLMMQVP
ncbi:hypothetical protein GLOIN_2v1882688 [Rhizophagus irregularis DAOM 181602=DAOM 197198]|uniref:Uncharacterized protein n=2 Tax=Rhizophagus irregularis TaxID=588596 RepID=A0A2P4PBF7_RHIID|nr:hypothetical protein GLOIN_2v1882688 [Rhizophagus irregularis DAOM 181602=DAOM 197198]POG62711.1 hypothetical protein GLOIN_2v1882688 [Rhizophagus irregularis DAOM 181602=DAOM 197198]|eukprot:XP_025169577.1 hypothetical protein GLOIN_2v1882688 [Rhizophagus irregularis DAOM 181602=DAOM 197198]